MLTVKELTSKLMCFGEDLILIHIQIFSFFKLLFHTYRLSIEESNIFILKQNLFKKKKNKSFDIRMTAKMIEAWGYHFKVDALNDSYLIRSGISIKMTEPNS